MQRDLKLDVGTLQETITVGAGPGWLREADRTPSRDMDPAERQKMEEYRAKRAASRRSGAASVQSGSPGTPRIGGNIRVPAKLRDVRPVYPASLATSGVSGTVLLRAIIDTQGNVSNIVVVSASHPEFTTSATNAVRQWQFDPTLLNGQEIDVVMNVTVNFEYRP